MRMIDLFGTAWKLPEGRWRVETFGNVVNGKLKWWWVIDVNDKRHYVKRNFIGGKDEKSKKASYNEGCTTSAPTHTWERIRSARLLQG